ncbi:MAG TPA: acireductone synthase [Burkholderiaceae bacterium]|nr:acireductone synthase [Burkholderiaceae bacterium]
MTPVETSRPEAVLLDIEGTVGSTGFVHDVLFPYARARLTRFVTANREDVSVAQQLQDVERQTGASGLDEQISVLQRWHDEGRKVTALKAIQGLIWNAGYASGELVSDPYDDAVAAVKRWRVAGLPVFIYSSGSVLAQKLYFAHTAAGDLTPMLRGHFDTTMGPKNEPQSYFSIRRAIGGDLKLTFLSDSALELVAASAAGLRSIQVRRPGFTGARYSPFVASFDDLHF